MNLAREICRALERPMLWLVLCVAASVMLSWKGGFEAGIRIIPGAAPMQFNTALCFFLLAIGGLRRHMPDMKWWIVAAISIAATTILQDYTRVNVGLDVHFQFPWYVENTPSPGRMAPLTAIGFIFLGAVRLANKPLLGLILMSMVLIQCAAALLGYVLHLAALYTVVEGATAMAVHTAALFCLYAAIEFCRLFGVWRERWSPGCVRRFR